MTFLPTGSVVLCEDDATQYKKKKKGTRKVSWLIGKICVYGGQCMLCRASSMA